MQNGQQQPGMNLKVTPETLMRNIVNINGVMKVVYSRNDGVYMGTIAFDSVTPEALSCMANDFQVLIAEQTGGLAIVGGLPGGIRKS